MTMSAVGKVDECVDGKGGGGAHTQHGRGIGCTVGEVRERGGGRSGERGGRGGDFEGVSSGSLVAIREGERSSVSEVAVSTRGERGPVQGSPRPLALPGAPPRHGHKISSEGKKEVTHDSYMISFIIIPEEPPAKETYSHSSPSGWADLLCTAPDLIEPPRRACPRPRRLLSASHHKVYSRTGNLLRSVNVSLPSLAH
jgi:hypothetical protein